MLVDNVHTLSGARFIGYHGSLAITGEPDFWDECATGATKYFDLTTCDSCDEGGADSAAGPQKEQAFDEQQIIDEFLVSCRKLGDGAGVHSAAHGSRLARVACPDEMHF